LKIARRSPVIDIEIARGVGEMGRIVEIEAEIHGGCGRRS
jgi:hypothetical protein